MRHAFAATVCWIGWVCAPGLVCAASGSPVTATTTPAGDAAAAAHFAALAIKCLHTPYPTHLSLAMESDADIGTPVQLHPAFYGCFDWHSAVHGHWLLVRLLRGDPHAPFAAVARAELDRSLNEKAIGAEVAYMQRGGRASFERPYGLAWVLKLAAELRDWPDPDAQRWSQALRPLETEVAGRLKSWLPKLHYPIRVGEHDQTAFSFGLVWDWAAVAGDAEMQTRLRDAAQRFYRRDRRCPLAYEPSGEDFLSPCLAEADFMRRVMNPGDYARWLAGFLPDLTRKHPGQWLVPAIVTDRSDPKLAHLDGLNLSRAWMLEGIAHGLPEGDSRRPALLAAAREHAQASLPAVTGEHYEGGHWLGTFAAYLTTGAGR